MRVTVEMDFSDEEISEFRGKLLERVLAEPGVVKQVTEQILLKLSLPSQSMESNQMRRPLPSTQEELDSLTLGRWYTERMGVSNRVANVLGRADVFPDRLPNMRDDELLAIRDFGQVGLREIRDALKTFGY